MPVINYLIIAVVIVLIIVLFKFTDSDRGRCNLLRVVISISFIVSFISAVKGEPIAAALFMFSAAISSGVLAFAPGKRE